MQRHDGSSFQPLSEVRRFNGTAWDTVWTSAVAPEPVGDNTPETLADLEVWLDAPSLTGYTEGQDVTGFSDRSGRTWTTPGGWAAPSYTTNAINGKPALSGGQSTSTLLETGAIPALDGAYTMFVVTEMPKSNSTVLQMFFTSGNDANVGQAYQTFNDATTFGLLNYSGTTQTVTSTTTDVWATPHFFSSVVDNDYISLNIDGDLASANYNSDTQLPSGHQKIQLFNGFLGQIQELIIYGRRLSTGEMTTVHQYLADKYPTREVPETVSGLVQWIDVSALEGFADGDPVPTFTDRTDVTWSGPTTTPPIYRANFNNGLPALEAVAGTDQLVSPGLGFDVHELTSFFVMEYDGAGTYTQFCGMSFSNSSTLASRWDLTAGTGIRLLNRDLADTGWYYTSQGNWSTNLKGPGVHLFNFVRSTTGMYSYTDGANYAGHFETFGGTPTPDETYVGHTETLLFNGVAPLRLQEAIFYNRELTDDERAKVESYLITKYNL